MINQLSRTACSPRTNSAIQSLTAVAIVVSLHLLSDVAEQILEGMQEFANSVLYFLRIHKC